MILPALAYNALKQKDKKLPPLGLVGAAAGYAMGTNQVTPETMGYYGGTGAAGDLNALEEQRRLLAAQGGNAPTVAAVTPPAMEKEAAPLGSAISKMGAQKASDIGTEYVSSQPSMLMSSIKDRIAGNPLGTTAGDVAFDSVVGADGGVNATQAVLDQANTAADAASSAAAGGTANLASSAAGGFGGAVVGDLLTEGKVDEKTLLKGGLAMGANMLLPGSGFIVGPLLSSLGLENGTNSVPPDYRTLEQKMKSA